MRLGEIVRQVTAQGGIGKLCEVRSMLNEPSAELVDENGHAFHWAQSLTKPVSPEDAIVYWKNAANAWKKRAAQHGCNTEEGDPECG